MSKSTEMTIDPLSDFLTLVKANAVVTGGFSAGGPWAIHFPARDKIKFFAVVKGECWGRFEGEEEWVKFETGDVGLLAVQRSFVLASKPDVVAVDAVTLFSGSGRVTATIGDGSEFEHLGGHVLLDQAQGSLLATVLPPWIHIRANAPEAAAFRSLLAQLVEERAGHQPGSQLASAQLTQLLFVQILRAHLRSSSLLPAGWLRASADPRISPALRLMHGNPERSWGLDPLAKACGMSRTTFAAHFRMVAGVPPLTYLTEWRMRLAGQTLRETGAPLAAIAQSLGYSSESAFSNAFKRVTGKSPKSCRAEKRLAGPSLAHAPSSDVFD
ncbi:AraC family transcriptional regulator [Rhizobium sp. P38BS-XIX]|uniref:AraC family transcriptional regulator n=1 Tax=Rhizobium sp. P38BS-XIX TaxID=2726740 RepID=UPI0032B148FF